MKRCLDEKSSERRFFMHTGTQREMSAEVTGARLSFPAVNSIVYKCLFDKKSGQYSI